MLSLTILALSVYYNVHKHHFTNNYTNKQYFKQSIIYIKTRTNIHVNMGGALSVQKITALVENKDTEPKDDRRRNSLAFYISQFVSFEEEDFTPLIEMIKKDKYVKTGGKPPTIRPSSECLVVF
jgi:hypothetical protein